MVLNRISHGNHHIPINHGNQELMWWWLQDQILLPGWSTPVLRTIWLKILQICLCTLHTTGVTMSSLAMDLVNQFLILVLYLFPLSLVHFFLTMFCAFRLLIKIWYLFFNYVQLMALRLLLHLHIFRSAIWILGHFVWNANVKMEPMNSRNTDQASLHLLLMHLLLRHLCLIGTLD